VLLKILIFEDIEERQRILTSLYRFYAWVMLMFIGIWGLSRFDQIWAEVLLTLLIV